MPNRSRNSQYFAGMKSAVPVILGFVPVGIAYAIMARQAGFSVFETCFMSLAVFAGASQMMAVGMYVQGAGVIAMILATFILNLRHLIMSTCVVNRMRKDKTGIKLLAAVCNTILSLFLASSWALIVSTLVCAWFGVFFVELS